MSKIVYSIEPELETETHWYCPVAGCSSVCFDAMFAKNLGCSKHGKMLRAVRQFENGIMITEFKEQA